MPAFQLKSKHRISLRRTLDIQIPALEWKPLSENLYKTIYVVGRKHVEIMITQNNGNSVIFSWKSASDRINGTVLSNLKGIFTFFMDEINVGTSPVLTELKKHYNDVYYMKTSPYRALLVSILSQNKTGNATRAAFFNLLRVLGEVSPKGILELDENTMREAIRIAGPYKTRYIIGSAREIIENWGGDLASIVNLPTDEALSALTGLPGVAHKTASCVLVYSRLRNDVFPIDTHLWRVVQRLGLVAIKTKSQTALTRQKIVTELRASIPDAGYAHLFFVMLGREYCHARKPFCIRCPLQKICPRCGVNDIP